MLFFRPPVVFLRRELLEAGVTGRGGLEFCLTPKSGGFL